MALFWAPYASDRSNGTCWIKDGFFFRWGEKCAWNPGLLFGTHQDCGEGLQKTRVTQPRPFRNEGLDHCIRQKNHHQRRCLLGSRRSTEWVERSYKQVPPMPLQPATEMKTVFIMCILLWIQFVHVCTCIKQVSAFFLLLVFTPVRSDVPASGQHSSC